MSVGVSVHLVAAVLAATLAGQAGHTEPTAQAQSTDKVRLAILGLRNDGVDPKVISQVVDAIALRMSKNAKTEVLTSTEIQAVMGLEAARQALDCDEGTCAAMDELTRALDVKYTIAGSIAPKGKAFYVHASLVDVKNSRSLTRAAAEVSLDDLHDDVDPIAVDFLRALHGESATASAVLETPASFPLLSWIGVGVTTLGVIGAGIGGFLWGVDHTTIADTTSPFATKEEARSRYLVDQAVLASGAGAAAIGATVIVAGVIVDE
jgi:TolB-like protein